MGRFALIVDLLLAQPQPQPTEAEADKCDESKDDHARHEDNKSDELDPVVFRVANVHLESLPQGAQARPEQLDIVARALREQGIFGGIVCGDMNAILERDRNTPLDVGLVDAYIGDDNDTSCHTWGYQPPCPYAPGRLDKILCTPPAGPETSEDGSSETDGGSPATRLMPGRFSLSKPERVGVGLQTSVSKTCTVWASDHYGLISTLCIKSSSSAS